MDTNTVLDPRSLAACPLFEIYRPWLAELGPALPTLENLNQLRQGRCPGLSTASGQPLRFVAPLAGREPDVGYEARIHAHGQVETRPDNWHDFFNALVWLAFPHTKAAISQRHAQELARLGDPSVPRGAVRDALTQFDECGIVVISPCGDLLHALSTHAWVTAFVQNRRQLVEETRFFLVGHGSLDALRTPYFGLCAKALYIQVEPAWLSLAESEQMNDADARIAHWIKTELQRPAQLRPLPLLGIPGVTPDNEDPSYYLDTRQFRPGRT